MLEPHEVDSLFPADLPEPGEWEERYPPRELPVGAEVTRLGPSPTGFIHLGGIYTAMIDRAVANQTGGRYFVRVEDTDQLVVCRRFEWLVCRARCSRLQV